MKYRKWLRWLALCMAALLICPALSEEMPAVKEPAALEENGGTEGGSPEDGLSTDPAPEPLPEPENSPVAADPGPGGTTDAPEETPAPDATDAPEGSSEPSAAEPEPRVVVAIAPLGKTEYTAAEKPSLEQAAALFPGTLTVMLADGTAEQAEVRWSCANYEADGTQYVFEAAFVSGEYAAAAGVGMPTAVLTIETSGEKTFGDFTGRISEDGGFVLMGYTGDAETVNLPEQMGGYRLSAIAATAFAGNDRLRKLTVPAGLIRIEAGAFRNCASLEWIGLPDSLEEIGSGIFDGCAALETIRLDISEEISMSDAKGYTRRIVEVVDGVERTRTVSPEIDRDFTDFCVYSGGAWNVEGALRIESRHAAAIEGGGLLSISTEGSIAVLGALDCAGTASNEGIVYACAGTVSGLESGVVREHSWSNGVCSVCGARETLQLGVEVLREKFEKVYDGTSGIDLGAEDFRLTGMREGDQVSIAAINVDFRGKDAGEYLAGISFELSGADAGGYTVKQAEIVIVIQKKDVVVTPRSGQSKVYGAVDPAIRAGYRGVIPGETLEGSLSREKGESVGRYRILAGTLEKSNPNYEIAIANAEFEITPRSISDSAVMVAKIANQRYTGGALQPEPVLSDGARTLVNGRDYLLSYVNNTQVGNARVIITGIGNYSGSREAGFRIIQVSASGGAGLTTPGFADAPADGASDELLSALNRFGADGALSRQTLTLDGVDYGEIVFDERQSPRSFFLSERQLIEGETAHRLLCLAVEENKDESGVPIEGDYGQPRLCLSMALIDQLRIDGYTDLEMIVGTAELRIPLSALYAEYVDGDGTLSVERYEARLWPVEALPSDRALAAPAAHVELLAVAEQESGAVEEDVLSLLDGVRLMIVPEAESDYQGMHYDVLCMALEESEAAYAPQGATFILDGDRVKCSVVPEFGGVYALVLGLEE